MKYADIYSTKKLFIYDMITLDKMHLCIILNDVQAFAPIVHDLITLGIYS